MSRRPFYGQTPAPQIARMDMQTATAQVECSLNH